MSYFTKNVLRDVGHHLPSLIWLTDPRARASGRTIALSHAFVYNAIKYAGKEKIKFYDHTDLHSMKSMIKEQIEDILHKLSVRFTINNDEVHVSESFDVSIEAITYHLFGKKDFMIKIFRSIVRDLRILGVTHYDLIHFIKNEYVDEVLNS